MLKNIGSNWCLLGVTILTTYFLVPFNLHYLGQEQYGHWLLIASLTGYLTLLQLGVPMASARQLTLAIARRSQTEITQTEITQTEITQNADNLETSESPKTIQNHSLAPEVPDEVNQVVASCAGMYLGLGTLAALVGLPLFVAYEYFSNIPHELREECRLAFLLALLQVWLGFLAQLPYGILHAYQDFVRKNAIATLMVLLRAALTVGFVLGYPSLAMLALAQIAVTLLEMGLLWGLILLGHPEIRPWPRHFSFRVVRQVFGFSIHVLLLTLGAQLAFQTDAVVIGWCLDAKHIPYFSVGNSLLLYFMQFIVGIAAVILPLATTLHTQNRLSELRVMFLKWSKITLALTWAAGAFLLVFGPDFLGYWAGSAFQERGGTIFRILLVSYLVLLPLRGVAVPILMGLGRAFPPAFAFLCAGLANLLLSLLLVSPWIGLGLEGVAWGTAIPNVVLAAILLQLVCRELGLSLWRFMAEVLPRALLGLALVLLVLGSWRHWWQPQGLVALVLAGNVTLMLFGLVWGLLVFRGDPHIPVGSVPNQLLNRLLNRFLRSRSPGDAASAQEEQLGESLSLTSTSRISTPLASANHKS